MSKNLCSNISERKAGLKRLRIPKNILIPPFVSMTLTSDNMSLNLKKDNHIL